MKADCNWVVEKYVIECELMLSQLCNS